MKTDTHMESSSRPRRFRRIGRLVIAVLLFAVAAELLLVEVADINPYVPLIETLVEKNTGLPTSVESLGISFWPRIKLMAKGVEMGEGDLRGYAPRAVGYVDWRDLLHLRINITEIRAPHVEIVIPTNPDEALERLEKIGPPKHRDKPKKDHKPDKPETVRIGVIKATGTARRADLNAPLLEFKTELYEVTGRTLRIWVESMTPEFGPNARLDTDISIGTHHPTTVKGTARLMNANPRAVFPGDDTPNTLLTADVVIDTPKEGLVGMDIIGIMTAIDDPIFDGTFGGKIWFDRDGMNVNGIVVEAPSVTARGDFSRTKGGEYACDVAEARIQGAALGWLARFWPDEQISVTAAPEAEVAGKNVLLGFRPGKTFKFARGQAAFQGLSFAMRDGGEFLNHVAGDVSVKENRFEVAKLDADGLTLTGSVDADFINPRAAVDLKGRATVSREQLAAFMDADDVKKFSAQVRLDRIAGTFAKGKGVPEDLIVEGQVDKGALTIGSGEYSDTWQPITADFSTTASAITTTIAAKSKKLGDVTCEGRYAFAERAWKGSLTGDLEHGVLPFIDAERARELLRPALAHFGPSTFDVTLNPPAPEHAGLILAAQRRGEPRLEGEMTFVAPKRRLELGAIRAWANVPMENMGEAVSKNLSASGLSKLEFYRQANDQTFVLQADLGDTAIWTAPTRLEKRAGDPVMVRFSGGGGSGGWKPRALTVFYNNVTLPMHFENGRLVSDEINADLSVLARLLPEDARFTGTLSGRFAASPFEMDFRVADATGYLSEDLAVQALSGPLSMHNGAFTFDQVHVSMADMKAAVSGAWSADDWRAAVKAQHIDVKKVDRFVQALQAFLRGEKPVAPPEPPPNAKPAPPKPPEPGMFHKPLKKGLLRVETDSLQYRRARMDAVALTVHTGEDGLRIPDLSIRRGEGRLTGSVTIPRAKAGAYPHAETVLSIQGLELSFLDELSFSEPRNLAGNFDGEVDLDVPFSQGVNPIDGATGSLAFVAKDGSLGKLGFATQILAVIKTAEVFRLRMPPFKDEGLTFDTFTGALTFRNGLMTFEEAKLDTPPLFMEARGAVNFPRKASDAQVRVSTIAPVTNVISHIPGLSNAADKVRYMSSMILVVEGNPASPSVRIDPAARIENFAQELKGAAKTGENVVKDGLVHKAVGSLDRLLGR